MSIDLHIGNPTEIILKDFFSKKYYYKNARKYAVFNKDSNVILDLCFNFKRLRIQKSYIRLKIVLEFLPMTTSS